VIRCTIFLGSTGKDGPIDTMLDIIILTKDSGLSPYNQVVFARELVGVIDCMVGTVIGLDASGVLKIVRAIGGAP